MSSPNSNTLDTNSISLLREYLFPQKGRLLSLAFLLFTNIGLQLINPQIMRRFIDTALGETSGPSLIKMALLFIFIAFGQQIISVGATYVSENIGWLVTNHLRYDLAHHCLSLGLPFHNAHTPGEMIERIDGDINTLSTFFSQFILQIVGNTLLLLGIIFFLFRENWQVGAPLLLFVIVIMLILTRVRYAAVPLWTRARQASAAFYSFVEEQLAGTEDIRANGAEGHALFRFLERLQIFWQTTVRARLLGFALVNSTSLLFAGGTALAFLLSARLYQSERMTLGGVYLVFHYAGMLRQPMDRISREIEILQQAGASMARVQEVRQIQTHLPHTATPVTVPDKEISVTFAGVDFAYEDGADDLLEWVLHQIDFSLATGRVLGLLGRTGSGKTTLTRLLFRLYDPQAGHISLNGIDLRHFELRQLRQKVGIVTQNVQLFHASVRDNLTFFDPSITDTAVLNVLTQVGLESWFASLPDGLDTLLSAGGSDLSAGQAQLLAFGRIFLKDPALVILDEASSRLDPATEQLIEKALDQLLQNRTVIIIAHRLATVQRADEILILENGRVIEQGTRTALAQDPTSRFAQLQQTGLAEVLV